MDGLSTKTIAFTSMNSSNERCVWGYRKTNTATINTTNYNSQALLIGDKQYTLAWGAYANFNKQTVSGDFEVEYVFDNYTQAAENWHNWAIAVRTSTETWYLRADAWSVSTFTGSTVEHSYTWDWTQFKEIYKNKRVKLKVSRIGTSINVFAYVDNVLVYTCTSKNSPTGQVDVYLGGETCYLDVKKISVSQIGVRQVVGTTNDDGTYPVAFNSVKGNTTSVSGDFELVYNFNNYHNPVSTDNWDNFILRAISGNSTMLIRADAFAMDVFGSLSFTYDWNWDNFISIMTGANVELKISRKASTITYKFIITARDGNVYNYQVVQTQAPTTDMSFGFTGEESMQDFFVVEKVSYVGPRPTKYVYNYDNSGNLSWTNINNWSPKDVPIATDTVIIRTGEAQITNLAHTGPVYVESGGTVRLVNGNSTVNDIHLQGGTLRLYTSNPGFTLTSVITVEKQSTIQSGSVATTVLTLAGTIKGNSDLTKTGVGILEVTGTATNFTGNWNVAEGTLRMKSLDALGKCGIKVAASAVLDIATPSAASIYSLVLDTLGKVALTQSLNTEVAVLGNENVVLGNYTGTTRPAYISGAGTLMVKNSILAASGSLNLCPGGSVQLQTLNSSAYSWKNGATQVGTTQSYSANAAGDYTISVSNANGCKVTSASAKITVNAVTAAAIATATPTNFCTGGSIVLTANQGAGYKWFNGTTQVGTAQTYTATAAGDYVVEVTNASGCKATSAKTTVTVNALPTATISTTTPTIFCEGQNTVLTSSIGSSYRWYKGTTSVGTNQTYTAISSGDYSVEVSNANGCKATSAKVTVKVNSAPVAAISSTLTSLCPGQSTTLAASVGSAYKWFNGTTQVGTAQTYVATAAGDYTVEVANANGCKATSEITRVIVRTAPTVTITSSTASGICSGESVTLTSSIATSYKWYRGTTIVGTSQTYVSSIEGNYSVEITDAYGCKAMSMQKQVEVMPAATWYKDEDVDGKGDLSKTIEACSKPDGYVATAGDGCPANPNKTEPGVCGCDKSENECLDCAGVPYGSAVIDDCEVCVGGTTGKAACEPTAIRNAFEGSISVAPQPFIHKTLVQVKNHGIIQSLTVVDALGAIVYQLSNVDNYEVLIGESLSPGLYSLVVFTDKGTFTIKVMKE